MRDRIVFFILGALLATLAYFAGDMQLSAHNTQVEGLHIIPKLLVEEIMVSKSINVGFADNYRIHMTANHEGTSIRFFHPNGKEKIVLALESPPTDPEAAYLSIASPNGKQAIGLFTDNDTEADMPFIVIVDDTGKARFMDTSSVNRIADSLNE